MFIKCRIEISYRNILTLPCCREEEPVTTNTGGGMECDVQNHIFMFILLRFDFNYWLHYYTISLIKQRENET